MIQSLKPPLNQLSLSIIPATLSSSLYVYLHGTHIGIHKTLNRKLSNKDPNVQLKSKFGKLFLNGKLRLDIKKDKKNRKDSYSNWNGNDDQLKREEEILGFECWILDGHDLSTIDSKLLDNLNSLEINQICLSYHGVYCYSINVNIIVLGLVVNGIQNRESVKDISRLLSSSLCLTTRTLHEHAQHKYMSIF
ncbi:hypothetical protein MJO28_015704 [Puccinia striiformis f. sp. tritici]|uniref:Uncharacterized protein n=1 Tax=Puccinia striiformis f. sp. tritici TaxID=168172 RepID=A0ACC0DPF6_9BASI|nr:hypothetical protein MJO28_015704 [Puccinia striiformis f. sp. tritici]